MKYVNVVIDNNSRYTDTFFTYSADDSVNTGDLVSVSFSRGKKEKRGYVFGECEKPDIAEEKIKPIISKDEVLSLNEEMIRTAMWMKQRYGIKYYDAVRCFVPKGKPAKSGKEKKPLKGIEGEELNIEALTEEQKAACGRISEAIEAGKQKSFLIHGVTGSGKTEVYMQAISEVLKKGKTALMLVPEIALTKQITDRFIGRFGSENIAILHSKLTGRERFDEWVRIRQGEAKVVIGARLGVFAPLENIGLIIMDEEHEATYKSDQTPKYETVDIALKRAIYHKAVLVLGSATPSVVSYRRALDGIYELIEMKERYNGAKLPRVDIVDMREELKNGNRGFFSDRLYKKIRETLDDKQQVILFLNRRGYSTFISCRECGEVLMCKECGISLTYHKKENACICHYCGKKHPLPKVCPECGSKYIKYFGVGTEQVEEFTKELFPDKTIERLDLDSAKSRREVNKIITAFSKGKTDILIGTQLVAKGLDFKNVGLVGVIAADSSLNIPDYRSAERTFQLVTQVSGRAGRGEREGSVVVQTYNPDNFAIVAAANHNYKDFYETEIAHREFMNYPPFADLIMVEFTSESEENALASAEICRDYMIKNKVCEDESNIFKPKLFWSFKGQDSFRYNILIKCPKGERNRYVFELRKFGIYLFKKHEDVSMTIDVNPYSTF